jgi:hypothetical protein
MAKKKEDKVVEQPVEKIEINPNLIWVRLIAPVGTYCDFSNGRVVTHHKPAQMDRTSKKLQQAIYNRVVEQIDEKLALSLLGITAEVAAKVEEKKEVAELPKVENQEEKDADAEKGQA